MASVDTQQIEDVLKTLEDENVGKNYVSSKAVKDIKIDGDKVTIQIELGYPAKSIADQIEGRTICAFGEAASWPVQSFIAKFKDEFEAKVKEQALLRKQGEDTAKETSLI